MYILNEVVKTDHYNAFAVAGFARYLIHFTSEIAIVH